MFDANKNNVDHALVSEATRDMANGVPCRNEVEAIEEQILNIQTNRQTMIERKRKIEDRMAVLRTEFALNRRLPEDRFQKLTKEQTDLGIEHRKIDAELTKISLVIRRLSEEKENLKKLGLGKIYASSSKADIMKAIQDLTKLVQQIRDHQLSAESRK